MGLETVVYDCEFATAPGAPQRFWCGPDDPDPVVFQIGAVRLSLDGPFDEVARLNLLVRPRERDGRPMTLTPLAERLTGIDTARLAAEGLPLAGALAALARFAEGCTLWSWGRDDHNLMGISCYVEGIAPPLPATRFGNATRLLVAAGVPVETVVTLRSNTLPDHFGLSVEGARAHDALGDARMVAAVLRHLMAAGRLDPQAMVQPFGA